MTFEDVLKRHGFKRAQQLTDDAEDWLRGQHPLVGYGVHVSISSVDIGGQLYPIFDVCIRERGEDESLLEWAESQNMVPEGFEKIATDGAYGEVWDIYGQTPEQLDEVLKRL